MWREGKRNEKNNGGKRTSHRRTKRKGKKA
jgi:hypothetical protein